MPKIAAVFPGQGSQYVGMGKELAEAFPQVKAVFAAADAALGYSLSTVCFEGPEEELRRTENTQPAILTTSIALYTLLKEAGIAPVIAAGHSLGEYSALVAAGAMPFADAVKVVRQRGMFMEQAVPEGKGTMGAILGLDGKAVEELFPNGDAGGVVEIATFNAPGQVVVAGDTDAVQQVLVRAKTAGAKRTQRLNVSGPFHSSLLREAGVRLAEVLKETPLTAPAFPVVANVSARTVSDPSEIRDALVRQVSSAVRWEESVRTMVEQGVEVFLEIGPKRVLSGLIRRIDKGVQVLNLEDLTSWEKVLAYAKGDIVR